MDTTQLCVYEWLFNCFVMTTVWLVNDLVVAMQSHSVLHTVKIKQLQSHAYRHSCACGMCKQEAYN